MPIKTAADNIWFFFFLCVFFEVNCRRQHFYFFFFFFFCIWIVYNSIVILFSLKNEKKKKKKKKKKKPIMVFSVKTDVSQLWIFNFSTAVTMKIRPMPPKTNQFFVMSQLYIHENLLRIQPLVHKILCRQKSITPNINRICTKINMSPSP